jgi:hypothetical protein
MTGGHRRVFANATGARPAPAAEDGDRSWERHASKASLAQEFHHRAVLTAAQQPRAGGPFVETDARA